MGKMRKKAGSLLDLLVWVRTHKALDRAVMKSKDYQYTLKQQDEAFDRLDKAGLSGEQKTIVVKCYNKNRFLCFTDLGFIVTTAHMIGKICMSALLGYQAYVWNPKRRAACS